jgi:hypothetical protein
VNQLTSLDVSGCIALDFLDCTGNQLTSMDVSDNTSIQLMIIEEMLTLIEVCVWTMPFPPAGVGVLIFGSPNVYFTTECTIGIEDNIRTGLSIYPNPVYNLLTIETEISDHYSIEILSPNGQQILSGEMEGTTRQIDLSSFQKGVYFITIRSKDFVTKKKIIKL